MRRAAIIAAAALGAVAAPPPAAHAGCMAAVVVDGRLLLGAGPMRRDALPPLDAQRPGILPPCNDGGPPYEEDQDTTVTTLRGIPPDVAVLENGSLYVAAGSLTAVRGHPLHRVLLSQPSPRARKTCRPAGTLRGRAAYAGPNSVTLLHDGSETVVLVDAATRMANRPASTPVKQGQALAVRASRCGRRRVADAIRFVGATVTPEPYERLSAGTSRGWGIVLMLGLAAAILVGAGRFLLGPKR